jgi:hypothetical protein
LGKIERKKLSTRSIYSSPQIVLKQNTMKTLTSAFGLGLFLVSGFIAPMGAQAKPLFSSPQQETQPNTSTSLPDIGAPLPDSSVALPRKMAAYKDCVNLHTNVNGADFKDVNKFCSCVADQSIQGSSGNLSDCTTASSGSGKSGGGAMGIIGEVAPSVISGVMDGLANRSSSKGGGLFGGGGGGMLGGLGDLLGGGSGNSGGGGGFNIRDLLKNRF